MSFVVSKHIKFSNTLKDVLQNEYYETGKPNPSLYNKKTTIFIFQTYHFPVEFYLILVTFGKRKGLV